MKKQIAVIYSNLVCFSLITTEVRRNDCYYILIAVNSDFTRFMIISGLYYLNSQGVNK